MGNSNLETEIIWQIPEYEYQPKDVSWFWISLILAIILIVLSLWQNNFLFSIFVAIAFLVINIWARRFPIIWEFKINKDGIFINLPKGENKKFYPMNELESFDIHDVSDEYKELVFVLKKKFSQAVKINIFFHDEEKIKNFLLKFVHQEEHELSLIDSLARLIGF